VIRVNEWLNRQTAWWYAFITGGCVLVGLLIAVGIMWWVTNGRFDIGFGLVYAVVLSAAFSVVSTFSWQRRRNRRN
jgi:membrane protein implicated in regulation of membrane protease activity